MKGGGGGSPESGSKILPLISADDTDRKKSGHLGIGTLEKQITTD